MIIRIKTTNIELNNALRVWVEEKVGELERVLGKFADETDTFQQGREKIELNVEIGRTTRHHRKGNVFRAEIQLYLPKKHLRVSSKNIDLRTALIEARDALDRKIRKYKGKRLARARKWARRAKTKLRTPDFLRRKRSKNRG